MSSFYLKFKKKIFIFSILLVVFYLLFELSKLLFVSYVKLIDYKTLLAKDYRGKNLPETQYLKVFLKKINITKNNTSKNKIKYLPRGYNIDNKFLIEHVLNKIFIMYANGSSYYYNVSELINSNKDKKIIINNNLKDTISSVGILDLLIHDNEIFISHAEEDIKIKNCYNIVISKSNLSFKNLVFKEFFKTIDCDSHSRLDIGGGRMKFYLNNNKKKILLTTSDYSGKNAQNLDSSHGKILEVDLNNSSYEIFSSGHRNQQGLIVVNSDTILSTEHGPMGGDEINLIKKNSNYGWNEASYGEPYKNFNINNKFLFNKDHSSLNFQEPIYAYIPAIGISEIINVNKNFSPKWNENFLITSLNGRSIYRVKFDKNYNKIITQEKIFVGERIRDITSSNDGQIFFLALEDTGSIATISRKDFNN